MLVPYMVAAGPSWLVVDGAGVVRGHFGGEEALKEWKTWRLMQFLVAERAHRDRADHGTRDAQGGAPSGVSHPSAGMAR
jgi:hypothetical protein